ncbi:MAG: PaaI family thioesterase [Planctomycetes bacterium]|nr:PaaI family thioesterase [Planctomycetota bacterium]MBL7037825.1 PaaI family thioesterase [Pirellulaceae bacterium]
MEADKKTVRTSKGLNEYTCVGCPLTRNRTAWCFRLCDPDVEGNGRCGRIAPHSLKGRTQLSIENYEKKQLEAHYEKLERLYLTAPYNEYWDPGVRISQGEAEILIPIQEKFLDAAGAVHASICFTAMVDSAVLAINSMVESALVVAVNFDTHLARPVGNGELIARSRFVGMSGNHYLAESVLTDSEGQEIGNGNGAFTESDAALSSDTEPDT